MQVTSSDHIPKEPLDTSVIIDNFRLSIDPTLYSYEIHEFYEKPTLRNAKRVLNAYNIQEPFRAPKAFIAVQEGGMIKPDSAAFKELLALDTLHDLSTVNNPNKIFKAITSTLNVNLPKALKDQYVNFNHRFTFDATKYLVEKLNLKFFSATNKEERQLFDYILRTRNFHSTNVLTIVLDNIVAGIKYDATLHEATIGFVGCAFTLVMYNNLLKCGSLKPNTSIRLYDGLFLQMDGNYIRRFITLFARSMKRLTQAKEVTVMPMPKQEIIKVSQPKYFNKNFNTHALIDLDASTISFNGKRYLIAPTSPNTRQMTYPHSKKQFQEAVEADPNNTKDLWYLNFLRDAFKADVALEYDAVYITHDRLAHMYYAMNGGKKGFLVTAITNDNRGTGTEYKVII